MSDAKSVVCHGILIVILVLISVSHGMMHVCVGDIIRQAQLYVTDELEAATSATPENNRASAASSPSRKRRTINSSYESHISSSSIPVAKPSAASAVALYLDELPILTTQARTMMRKGTNYWEAFRHDVRFQKLHPLMEKILCVPATSAPVERVFSHGGLFIRPHRARLGKRVLANLVLAKCNKHLA